VKVYGSPFVSDPKRRGEDEAVLVSPVSTTVMMYPVIAAPLPVAPLNSTVTALFPGVPDTTVGGFGIPAGVTDAPLEFAPRPTAFSAATVNVYATPLVRPVISAEVDPVVIDAPPGCTVITY